MHQVLFRINLRHIKFPFHKPILIKFIFQIARGYIYPSKVGHVLYLLSASTTDLNVSIQIGAPFTVKPQCMNTAITNFLVPYLKVSLLHNTGD